MVRHTNAFRHKMPEFHCIFRHGVTWYAIQEGCVMSGNDVTSNLILYILGRDLSADSNNSCSEMFVWVWRYCDFFPLRDWMNKDSPRRNVKPLGPMFEVTLRLIIIVEKIIITIIELNLTNPRYLKRQWIADSYISQRIHSEKWEKIVSC